MSHLHSQGRRYFIYDDVLDADQVNNTRKTLSRSDMTPAVSPINRFHDGAAFKSLGPRGTLASDFSDLDQSDVVQLLAATCIRHLAKDEQSVRTWAYSSSYMAYPVGTQLSWHDHGDDGWVGVYNYYVDPWSGDWGGELDIIDCDPASISDPGTYGEGLVESPVNITSVFPRMNRLVIIESGTWHRVRRIDPLAGSNVRLAISGWVAIAEPAV